MLVARGGGGVGVTGMGAIYYVHGDHQMGQLLRGGRGGVILEWKRWSYNLIFPVSVRDNLKI